jgi:hypothetical protein
LTDAGHILTIEEITVARSAAELLPWVYSAIARFRVTPELRVAAREGRQNYRYLVNEVLPMARFASGFFCESHLVLIRPVAGNQEFDGTVEDRRQQPSDVRFIEVTTACVDSQEVVRSEILNREVKVSAFGEVTWQGTMQKGRTISVNDAAQDADASAVSHLRRICDVTLAKARNRYPASTALCVAVNEHELQTPEDVELLLETARAELVPRLRAANFCTLAFVGGNGFYYPLEVAGVKKPATVSRP